MHYVLSFPFGLQSIDGEGATAPDGSVYVVWTTRVESNGKKGTDLYLSVSSDMGQTFGTPVKINDDKRPAAHGMHSLDVADDGRIFVSWLDERNVVATRFTRQLPAYRGRNFVRCGCDFLEASDRQQ